MVISFTTDIYIIWQQKIYIDNGGSGVKPKQKVRKLHYFKYQQKYGNRSYVISGYYIKDTRICRTSSRIKRTGTGFVYLKGSPYCDYEVSSHLRSCLHDEIINSAPIIGEILKNELYR